jgi:hypothetical protein
MKQKLQIKTLLGISEKAKKYPNNIAMIVFLLLDLIRRIYCGKTAINNFFEKVGNCLVHNLTFGCICSKNWKVQKVIKPP